MRVLVFAESFGTSTKTFIYNEVLAISRYAEVWVVCTFRDNMEPVPFPNVIEIPWKRNRIINKIHWVLWQRDIWFGQASASFRKSLDKVLDQIKPDVIHCHFANEAILITDNLSNHNIPVVITFHGYDATRFDDKKSYHKKLKNTFSKKNIYPMFVSGYIRQRVEKLGVDVKKGYLLYLGIDFSRFARMSYPGRENGVLFVQVSSFAAQKGHKYTVVAIKKFLEKYPDIPVKFVFGGDGYVELEVVRKQVIENNLQEYISFTGMLKPNDVRDLLESAHIFLHPSVTGPFGETEGLPTAIMEAMAMELPILTTWHAGIPELVQDRINGLLVQEKDIDDYVSKMHEIISWGYLKQNRERVLEMCEIDKHAKELIQIYKEVIAKV